MTNTTHTRAAELEAIARACADLEPGIAAAIVNTAKYAFIARDEQSVPAPATVECTVTITYEHTIDVELPADTVRNWLDADSNDESMVEAIENAIGDNPTNLAILDAGARWVNTTAIDEHGNELLSALSC